MEIVSALKKEASKLQKQLNSINSAIEILGREEQRRSCQAWQETAHVCKRESQNSEGAKSAVGKVSSGKGEGQELEQAFRKAIGPKAERLRSASGNSK